MVSRKTQDNLVTLHPVVILVPLVTLFTLVIVIVVSLWSTKSLFAKIIKNASKKQTDLLKKKLRFKFSDSLRKNKEYIMSG